MLRKSSTIATEPQISTQILPQVTCKLGGVHNIYHSDFKSHSIRNSFLGKSSVSAVYTGDVELHHSKNQEQLECESLRSSEDVLQA